VFNGVGDDRLQRALVVTAHPGDLQDSCSATVRRLTSRGASVALVVVTSGEKRTEMNGRSEAAGVRGLEPAEKAAAAELGVTRVTFLREPEAEVEQSNRLRGRMVAEIRRWRPDVVLTFDPTPALHQHPDHRVTGRLALDAAWPCAGTPNLYPDAGPPHQTPEAWLFDTATPDLFVLVPPELGSGDEVEEKFAQVDFRRR
jgi:LmbE family N-acetylglucosaminyl deacetylase